MNGRLGIRIGGTIAVAACALLVACGGGGGGGGGTPPTPAPTATPTPIPAPISSASGTVSGSSSVQLSFGPVSSGNAVAINSGSITFPAVTSGGGAVVAGKLSATSSNVSAPQVRQVRAKSGTALGIQSTIAYFQITSSTSITLPTSPAFSVTLPTALSASNNYYLLFDDPTSVIATGWMSLGSITLSNGGTTLTSAQTMLSPAITLAAGQTYYFALSSTGAAPIQTPGPVPTMQTGTDAALPNATLPPAAMDGWTPHQVAAALDFPVMHGFDGTGQTIVVLGDATPSPADVSTYLNAVGLSARPGGALSVVNINGGPNGTGSADSGEATLDVETVLSLAPGAKVEFYAMADTSEQSFLDAETQLFTDPNNPKIMSISFGGCEYTNETLDDANFKKGVTQFGIAYTAASGDQGNQCYNGGTPQYAFGTNSPASDPYVIGVGGNENANAAQTGNGSLTSTQVWNDQYLSGPGASGGGVSTVFTPAPTYQQPFSANLASTAARNVPDIAMPSEGVAVFQGTWQIFGGTSWSAPVAAALIAELNEYCGGTSTNAVAMFYSAYTASKGAAFIDVISGNNQFMSATPVYSAKAGYDNVSGLGLPIGSAIAGTMCPSRTWQVRTAAQSLMYSRESYGEARDTDLGNAVNIRRYADMGQRASAAITPVTILMRDTATVAQDVQSVTSALQASGIHVDSVSPSHLLVHALAPTATIEAYFRTSLHNVDQGRFGQRYANATSITLPAAIAPYVKGAVADNLILRHRLSHRMR